ncbi:hypothetical protein T07_1413 [Trichinella nelsoni]|uniref:Uncharacterized protein n=1 Tax=Trichinella nelsoni TaxID=6336 RepID=A0A0V0SGR1_9BILA|nr:hypothetical protein T07_1413 [Trichinella nelsoni]
MFRTESHRPRRLDPTRADDAQRSRTEEQQYPRTAGPGSERPPAAATVDRCAPDNRCLRHCASCGSIKYPKKPPDGRARQMTIARSKGPKA